MDGRLERALLQIARRYAPSLVPAGWRGPGDYQRLTGDDLLTLVSQLAAANVLVFTGEVPPDGVNLSRFLYKDWVDTLVDIYTRLAQALFPSYMQVSALYADQTPPPVAFLVGAATPVVLTLHGAILPYVTERCGTTPSDTELRGLMDGVLEDLEAVDMPRAQFRDLRDSCAVQVRELCLAPVKMRALSIIDTQSPSLPPAPPELPDDRPPEPPPLPEAPRPSFAAGDIPIFFDPTMERGRRRPPVPNLPNNE